MSKILERHKERQFAHKYSPTRAALFQIEAMADHRIDNDVNAMSKLTAIVDLCRTAIEQDDYMRTGQQIPFHNPLYD